MNNEFAISMPLPTATGICSLQRPNTEHKENKNMSTVINVYLQVEYSPSTFKA